MVVGILQLELSIEGAQSLKDKRRVVKSLKDRLHREHQVSVAEVDFLEDHQRAVLGVTMASNDVKHCQSMLDKLVERLSHGRDFVLADHQIQILTGQ